MIAFQEAVELDSGSAGRFGGKFIAPIHSAVPVGLYRSWRAAVHCIVRDLVLAELIWNGVDLGEAKCGMRRRMTAFRPSWFPSSGRPSCARNRVLRLICDRINLARDCGLALRSTSIADEKTHNSGMDRGLRFLVVPQAGATMLSSIAFSVDFC
jgi:hypothetical protein